jgi:AraC-like DNA-binding protein
LVVFVLSTTHLLCQDTSFVRSLPIPDYVKNICSDGAGLFFRTKDSIYQWTDAGYVAILKGHKRYSWAKNENGQKVFVHSEDIPVNLRVEAVTPKTLLPGRNWNAKITEVRIAEKYFICMNGIVLEYIIRDSFYLKLKGHSIRHIYSEPNFRFVSTYSGLFIDTIWSNYGDLMLNDRLGSYSNGVFRKLNNRYYLCQDNLLEFNRDQQKLITLIISENQPRFRDIFEFSGRTIAIMTNGICELDSKHPKILRHLFPHVIFTGHVMANDALFLSTRSHGVFKLDHDLNVERFDTMEEINDISQYNEHLILCTDRGLYQVDYQGRNLQLVAPGEELHSAIVVAGILIYAGNFGLRWFDGNSSGILIDNIEFNKYALSFDEHNLYAGSINGLYVISMPELTMLTLNKSKNPIEESPDLVRGIHFWLPLIFMSTLFILIGLNLYLSHSKLKEKSFKINPTISALSIEKLMLEDESIKSVDDIARAFETSVSQINRKLKQEGQMPLGLLKKIKQQIVDQMIKDGKSIADIAKRVGYSKRYVREHFLKKP